MTSLISWIPFVTGSSAVSDRTGSLNSSIPSTKPEKNTDASSSSSDSWTACRSESEIAATSRPSPSDAAMSSSDDAGEGRRVAEHRHAEPEDRAARA